MSAITSERSSLPNTENQKGVIGLFDVLILFIVSTSVASLFLLVLNRFNSVYALTGGLFLTVICLLVCLQFFNYKIVIADKRFDLILALILVVAFFIMAKPYLYIMGGQDQGLYVNMSSTYERTGSTFIQDHLRQSLGEPERIIYDEQNFLNKAVKKTGEYEGNHLPGIYIKNLAQSEYVYQFYPLHPLWMAIFGKLLGHDNRVYALVFFALIAIVAFYLLAYELSGRKRLPGYLIAFFLAINPLFTFFSKFPVSEMVTVTFSSLGFYYLLRYYREAKEGEANGLFLILSSLSFLCLFFTHISGFLWIPFFYLLLLLTLVFITDRASRIKFLIYALSVLAGYGLSLWYGLVYSFPYSNDLYGTELGSRLVKFNWKWELGLLAVVMTLLPFGVYRLRQNLKNKIERWAPHLFNLTSLLIALLIPLNIYEMYRLKPNLSSLQFLFTSTSYVALLYLTPFGLLLLLGALNQYRKIRDCRHFLLLLLLLLFWVTKVYIPAESGYQYYSSRYIFNEVTVYSLLIMALYAAYLLQKKDARRWLWGFLIAGLSVYSLTFTAYQFQGQEADGANQALKRVAGYIDEKDLLLSTSINHEVVTPLKYYFALPLFAFHRQSLQDENFVNALLDQFNDVFVLAPEPLYNPQLEIVDIIDYKEGIFGHPIGKIPTEFFYHNEMNLYLYRISRTDYFITNKIIRPKNYPLKNFYGDSYWTDGNGIISGLKVALHPKNKYIILKTGGHNALRGDLARLNLRLLINESELKFSQKVADDYYFELDPQIKEINEIRVLSSTFIPKEFGINDDARPLGMDVDSFRIK